MSPLDRFDHLSVFSILDSRNLFLCVNAAPAKAALGTCHGNLMSGINVVLRYMTRDLILHHSSGRLERRHTCVRMDSAVTSNELQSRYSHFLFSKTRPDEKKKWMRRVRRTIIHIQHHVLMISMKVRPMETGYWTEFLHVFIENAEGRKTSRWMFARTTFAGFYGDFFYVGSPGTTWQPLGCTGKEDV